LGEVVGVPCSEIAHELGQVRVKNIVALGALARATGLFPAETYLTAIRQALRDKPALAPLNEQAFARGQEAAGAAEPADMDDMDEQEAPCLP
jgi:Pyruvate/2-oxoacid:ferredoxin oxidoreductase gamma subunit